MMEVLLVIMVLVNVAFFTLLERKILGLSQSRKGPNKVSLAGLAQPFSDAVKLFLKETVKPHSSSVVFYLIPGAGLLLALFLWTIVPLQAFSLEVEFSVLGLLVILSLGLYPLLLMGWVSNSKYALVGAIRGVAQTLSYEISLALVVMSLIFSSGEFSLQVAVINNSFLFLYLSSMSLLSVWMISCVAETNRTPFDFAEGESELVSGFNIEYGGGALL